MLKKLEAYLVLFGSAFKLGDSFSNTTKVRAHRHAKEEAERGERGTESKHVDK